MKSLTVPTAARHVVVNPAAVARIVADRDRARAIAVALEQEVATLEALVATLDAENADLRGELADLRRRIAEAGL